MLNRPYQNPHTKRTDLQYKEETHSDVFAPEDLQETKKDIPL